MKKTITWCLLVLSTIVNAQNKLPFELEKDWELHGFKNPESVVLDNAENFLYLSNVNGSPTEKDGNGFISKISAKGKILELKWIDGLNAPKGLCIYKRKLYIADINEIVEVNLKTKEVKKFLAKEATFLNDITSDEHGNIYASNTFGFSGIFKLNTSLDLEAQLWFKSDDLNMPNGLSINKNKLIVATWGEGLNAEDFSTEVAGQLLEVDLETKSINALSTKFGNLDGLSETIHGYFISDWVSGTLFYFSNNKLYKALDLTTGSADTFFDKKTKALYIPMMLDNKLIKVHIKK